MEFKFSYKTHATISSLSSADQKLIEETRTLSDRAYAPYSKFKVASIVQLKDGTEVPGINIENASYPVGICAERSALAAALSAHRGAVVESLAISYNSIHSASERPLFPCGMCRQFILECQHKQDSVIRILLSGQAGQIIEIQDAAHLLPFAFDGKELKG